MASLFTDASGSRTLQFKDPNGKRRTLRLGPIPKRDAEEFRRKLELLLSARLSRLSPPREVAEWLADLGQVMLKKLVRVGALSPEQPGAREATTDRLGEFLDLYSDKRTDVKSSTKTAYGQTIDFLKEYFGQNRPLRDITAGDADDFRLWLLTKVGDNTTRRHCGRAKQFFRAAVRKKLIDENPFADMRECTVRANKSREYFVSLKEAAAVLDACPDLQWRLLFALARFGGLRCPSEVLLLKLSDVDWERGRIRITSPKTEHHEGKDERFIPIFPELRPLLLEAAEVAPPGTEYVITKYRDENANLRTQLERIIARAGLKKWPRLFQNLRASRETELAQSHPIHVVCAWMGNSQLVAAKHYLQVRDEDFTTAGEKPSTLEALQDALRQAANDAAQGRTNEGTSHEFPQELGCIPNYSLACTSNDSDKMALSGLECRGVNACPDKDLRLSPLASAASGAALSPNLVDAIAKAATLPLNKQDALAAAMFALMLDSTPADDSAKSKPSG